MQANYCKWGLDADHNILFITGHSGSGKTVISNVISQLEEPDKINTIHLDAHYDMENVDVKRNDDFMSFMLKNTRWPYITADYIRDFGRSQFNCGKKVIVEGFQICDDPYLYYDMICADNSIPIIILDDNAFVSFIRSYKKNKKLMKWSEIGSYIAFYWDMSRKFKTLRKKFKAVRI